MDDATINALASGEPDPHTVDGLDDDDDLDDDDLDTILIVARNGQSGRITEREIKLLVAAYRSTRTR